jgi:cysteate synthase
MEVKPLEGVWKYLDWIPTSTSNEYVAGTTTYKAEALGEALGMSNLWVTFHGYWPEKGAMCPTGSFKDMEAVPTIQRLHDHGCTGLICASAGNTARGLWLAKTTVTEFGQRKATQRLQSRSWLSKTVTIMMPKR